MPVVPTFFRSRRTPRFLGDCRGTVAAEFALVVSTVSIVMIGVVDYALGYGTSIKLRNAVQAGASYCYSSGDSSCTETNVRKIVVRASSLTDLPEAGIKVTKQYGCPEVGGVAFQGNSTTKCKGLADPGYYATVKADYAFTTLLGKQVITFSESYSVRLS
jgi:Flp pilus assembly protein TadG